MAKQRQLIAETHIQNKLNIPKVDMTAKAPSSELISLGPDEILSKYARSLPGDPINFGSITQYLNSIDKYESSRRYLIELVTSSELILDPEFQLLSPQMQSFQLNLVSIAATSQASTVFSDCIYENQLYINKQSIRKFRKQQAIRFFKINEPVSVAVLVLDQVLIDNKRIFRQVIYIHSNPSYEIQIKFDIFNRNFPMSQLILFPSTINLEILTPASDQKISLHIVTVCKSTIDKVPIFYKCKDKCNWCAIWKYICIKAGIKYRVAFYGGGDNDNVECPNLDIPHPHLQKGLQVRDRDDK